MTSDRNPEQGDTGKSLHCSNIIGAGEFGVNQENVCVCFSFTPQTPVLSSTLRLRPEGRYAEEPDRAREESGSSEYLRTGVGRIKPPLNKMPTQLPKWALDLIAIYKSDASNQFLINGNVYDRLVLPTNTPAGNGMGTLDDFFLQSLLGPFASRQPVPPREW